MDTAKARHALESLRDDINTALDAVRDNNPGLALTLGRCSFSASGGFTFKLDGTLAGGESREALAYARLRAVSALPTVTRDITGRRLSESPGLELPELNTTFLHRGRTYQITGATPRGKVLTQRDDGKVFTWAAGSLAHVVRLRK